MGGREEGKKDIHAEGESKDDWVESGRSREMKAPWESVCRACGQKAPT